MTFNKNGEPCRHFEMLHKIRLIFYAILDES